MSKLTDGPASGILLDEVKPMRICKVFFYRVEELNIGANPWKEIMVSTVEGSESMSMSSCIDEKGRFGGPMYADASSLWLENDPPCLNFQGMGGWNDEAS